MFILVVAYWQGLDVSRFDAAPLDAAPLTAYTALKDNYIEYDIGKAKTSSAKARIFELNPDIKIIPIKMRLDASNIDNIIKDYDIVADGSDNFETRFIVNNACLRHKKTLVAAAVTGFFAQVYSFKPYLGAPYPCYQCIYPELPDPDATPSCLRFGVLGSVAGIVGSWQATEIIKELLDIGQTLAGNMIMIDALYGDVLYGDVKKVKINRNPACSCCKQGV